LASSSAVSAISTTAAATGIVALESYMLRSELMKGVPPTEASISLLLSDLFWPSELYGRYMGFVVNHDRIQIWNGVYLFSVRLCIYI